MLGKENPSTSVTITVTIINTFFLGQTLTSQNFEADLPYF